MEHTICRWLASALVFLVDKKSLDSKIIQITRKKMEKEYNMCKP